jgi:hypothetical protein
LRRSSAWPRGWTRRRSRRALKPNNTALTVKKIVLVSNILKFFLDIKKFLGQEHPYKVKKGISGDEIKEDLLNEPLKSEINFFLKSGTYFFLVY